MHCISRTFLWILFIFTAFYGLQWVSSESALIFHKYFNFIQFPNIHCIWRRLNLWSQFFFSHHFILCTLSCLLNVLFCTDVLTFAPFARMQSENESSYEREPFNQLPLNRISKYHCFYWLFHSICVSRILFHISQTYMFVSYTIQTSNNRLARAYLCTIYVQIHIFCLVF